MLKGYKNFFKSMLMSMATVLTNLGVGVICNRLHGVGTEPIYIGWGTGATAPAVTATDVSTPAAEARVAGTPTVTTTTVANDTYQVQGTITSASSQTITNAANFDALTAGNIFILGDFTGIPVNPGDSIQFTIKDVQLAA